MVDVVEAIFTKRITREGENVLKIYIPRDIVELLKLKKGDFVEVRIKKLNE